MKTVYYNDETEFSGRYAATVGFFDGVHRGHCFLISQLKEQAGRHGLQSMVITFERHPRQVLQPEWHPQFLSTFEEKAQLLEATGIDVLVVLRFTQELAALSARDFMQQVLRNRLGVHLLLTGYDNRFGNGRKETFSDYQRYGSELGIQVECAPPISDDGQRFSSSLVRTLLHEGRMEEAASCLGRPYMLTGTVVHGEQIGRTLGYPTANLLLSDASRLVPASGVYAVRVDGLPTGASGYGMMNIGCRPTFDGHEQTLEVNIFDFNGNLYGRKLTISFLSRLREERHFDSSEDLTLQMEADAQAVKRIIKAQKRI